VSFTDNWVVIRDAASAQLLALEWTAPVPDEGKPCPDHPFYERSFQLDAVPDAMITYTPKDEDVMPTSTSIPATPHVLLVAPAGAAGNATTIRDLDLALGTSEDLMLDFPVTRLACAADGCGSAAVLYHPAEVDAWLAVLELGSFPALRENSPIKLPRGLHDVFAQLELPPRNEETSATPTAACRVHDGGDTDAGKPGVGFLLTYATQGAGILDVDASSVCSFANDLPFHSAMLDSASRVWSDAVGMRTLRFADLKASGAVFEVELGAEVAALIPVGVGEEQVVVAVHPSTLGDVTVIDMKKYAQDDERLPRRRLFLQPGLVRGSP
jgi:hypothetical protein